ncbi:phage holin family protein [Candidatus Nitrospira salsa]
MIRTEEEQSLSEMFKELIQEVKVLLKQEVDLVKAEMSQKFSRAGKDVLFVGIGVALAYGGLLVLLGALVLLVAQILPTWVAALLVGLVVIAVGYGLVQKGLSDLKHVNPVPHKAINALKEEKQWIPQQVR